MSKLMVIQVSPDEFKNEILQEIKLEIQGLKKDFRPKDPPEYLTRNEVAKLLKVDISTVHNFRKRGLLTAYSIGSRVYYKRCDLENSLIRLKK